MKKFLLKILISCIGIILLNVLFYLHRKEGVNSYFYVFDKKFQHKTFLFADSHGNCLKKDADSFNINSLAYSSDSYKDILRKLEYLIKTGVDIDTLILTVDPHTLSPYREVTNNDQYSSLIIDQLSMYLPIFNAQYTTSLPFMIETRIKKMVLKQANSDNKSIFSDLSQLEKEAAINGRFRSQFPSPKLSNDLKNDLIRIIEICGKEGIILYGIRFPLVSQYSAKVKDHDYGAYTIFHNNRIPIFDYQSSPLPETYFINQDHLNVDGGYELLKMIKRDLLKPSNMSADGL